jgi:hypothetical protein
MFEELIQTVVNCATLLHDVASQTAGTFQFPKVDEEGNYLVDELNQQLKQYATLFQDKNKLLSFLTNPPSAYVPENMHDAVEMLPGQDNGEAPLEEDASAEEPALEEEYVEETPEGE